MTNRLAVLLALLIITALAYDFLRNEFEMSLFLARRLLDLIEWVAFWR